MVHVHSMASLHLELSYLYARLFRKRLVVTGHYSAADLNRLYTKRKNGKKPLRLQYWETRMKKIMDYATLIAITEEEADAYRTLFGFQNIAVIPNGIRLAEFTPKEHKENFIIFIGRIVPEKRLEFLLEAHKKLEHPLPLIVAGYAPDSAYLDKLKSLAGSGVSFINPPRQQLVELLGKAKALVLPSKNEAFGIVLLEAMASNALVLASNSGGFPTVVGDAGLLFNPDDPRTLQTRFPSLTTISSARVSARRVLPECKTTTGIFWSRRFWRCIPIQNREISVICTVYNEEENINALVESLLSQSLKPKEIIITDGGSTDGTLEILKDLEEKHHTLKVYSVPGNRAKGRNAAIAKSTAEYIAVTDAGCVADPFWLEKISEPLFAGAVVASGFTNQ